MSFIINKMHFMCGIVSLLFDMYIFNSKKEKKNKNKYKKSFLIMKCFTFIINYL